MKKPTLGVMPRWLWLENRKCDLLNAVCRAIDNNDTIRIEWINEYNKIQEEVNADQ